MAKRKAALDMARNLSPKIISRNDDDGGDDGEKSDDSPLSFMQEDEEEDVFKSWMQDSEALIQGKKVDDAAIYGERPSVFADGDDIGDQRRPSVFADGDDCDQQDASSSTALASKESYKLTGLPPAPEI